MSHLQDSDTGPRPDPATTDDGEQGSLVTEYGLVAVVGATVAGFAIRWCQESAKTGIGFRNGIAGPQNRNRATRSPSRHLRPVTGRFTVRRTPRTGLLPTGPVLNGDARASQTGGGAARLVRRRTLQLMGRGPPVRHCRESFPTAHADMLRSALIGSERSLDLRSAHISDRVRLRFSFPDRPNGGDVVSLDFCEESLDLRQNIFAE